MKIASGIDLIDACEGQGAPAAKGDRVVYNLRIFLNQGDEVRFNEAQLSQVPPQRRRVVVGHTLIDRETVLGRRQTIAGVERALIGMKPGGYRKVRVSPHLAYRDQGVPGLIPPDAVLVIEIWLCDVCERGV